MQETRRARLLKPVWFRGTPHLVGDKVEWPGADIDYLVSTGAAELIESDRHEYSDSNPFVSNKKKKDKGD